MPPADERVRLNRYLALAGLGTRRSVERLIASGRIAVNGEAVREPAVRVAPADTVTLDGHPLVPRDLGGVLVRLVEGEVPRLAHPVELHLAGTDHEAQLAVLVADPQLARGLRRAGYDPGRLRAGALAPGAFRPLSPAELTIARLVARRRA